MTTGNKMRDCLLLSIAVALMLAIVGAASPPLTGLLAWFAPLSLGCAAGLWLAALLVLSDGMIHVEVVTLKNQRRTHGLIAVVA